MEIIDEVGSLLVGMVGADCLVGCLADLKSTELRCDTLLRIFVDTRVVLLSLFLLLFREEVEHK